MKIIITLLLLGGDGYGGYYVYTHHLAPVEKRACERLHKLCSGDHFQAKLQNCEQTMKELEKLAGKEGAQKSMKCLADADSCAGGVGCLAGAGANAIGEFLKGVQKAIGK